MVPAGSLSSGARIVAKPYRPRRATRRGSKTAISLRVVGGRLRGPVELTLPYRRRAPASKLAANLIAQLAYYDAKSRRWRTVPGRYNRKRNTVTATIRHLSIWDPRTWDWRGALLQLEQAVGSLRGVRASGPTCATPNNIPRWFDPSVRNEDGLPLRTCAEGWPGDRAIVKVVNNRPYGMMLKYGSPVTDASKTLPREFHKAFGAMVGDALASNNELFLPPLEERIVVFTPGSTWQFGVFQASISFKSLAADLAAVATEGMQDKFTERMAGKLVEACSWMFKPGMDGTPLLGGDILEHVEGVADCLSNAAPELARAGLIQDWKADRIQKRFAVMAKFARGTGLALKFADYFAGWTLDGRNASFSVAYGNQRPSRDQPPPVDPTPRPNPTPGPTPTPAPTTPPHQPDRRAVTSYDRMSPGAPYHGFFNYAWQPFVAQSNTITEIGITVGNRKLTPGAAVPYYVLIQLCSGQPAGGANCPGKLAEVSPQIINYGNSAADIGDIGVSKGATYWVQWLQPAQAEGEGWVTYWWAGGSTIGASDQMQMVVKGYDR